MKLGYVSNSPLFQVGCDYGYLTGEWIYLEALLERATHADVFTQIQLSMDNADLRLLNFTNASVFRLNRARYVRSGRQLLQRAGRWDFAFLMAPSWNSFIAASICRQRRIPFAVCFRGEWDGVVARQYASNPIRRTVQRPLVRLVESSLMRNATIRLTEGGVLSDRYTDIDDIIPCLTIDIPIVEFRSYEESLLIDRHQILFVGGLSGRKGEQDLVNAIHHGKERLNGKLKIVGNGAELESLRSQVRQLGLEDRIDLPGALSQREIFQEYRRSKMLVLPSYSEGFPRVVLEAFSQSIPVITTPVGAQGKELTHEHHCLFVTPGDVKGLASAILRLQEDAELRERLSRNGFQYAKALFENHPLQRFEEALGSTLGHLETANSK